MNQNHIKVTAIPAFNDNYIWAIENTLNQSLALVDPGDADVCIAYIETHKLKLTDILITHHHNDHTGGIETLKQYCESKQRPLTVYGSSTSTVDGIDKHLSEGEELNLNSLNINFSIIEIPGHTLDHIAFYHPDMLFCGDTLFSGGCGRLFEGTPEQMHDSLAKLTNLPDSTPVYCTHEYTLANLNFALMAEPNNLALIQYYNQVVKLREHGHITLPSSISREKAVNPFVRTQSEEIIESATEFSGQKPTNSVEVFTAIRQWKDNA